MPCSRNQHGKGLDSLGFACRYDTDGSPEDGGKASRESQRCSVLRSFDLPDYAREKIREIIHNASRRSGVIMLDLCGTGAFGYVMAQSNLGKEIYGLGQTLSLLVLPFLVSAMLQLTRDQGW